MAVKLRPSVKVVEEALCAAASPVPVEHLGTAGLRDFASMLHTEWLVTNGLGGYASSTVLGVDTRRYHGLLVAALRPPVDRMLLLARLNETLTVRGEAFRLDTAEYHDGTVYPTGYLFLEAFRLDGTLPVWRFRCGEAVLEKTLWMEYGRNTVYVRYRVLTAPGPVGLRLEPLISHRDYHAQTRGDPDWRFGIQASDGTYRIEAFPGATPLWLRLRDGRFVETGLWYWRFLHRRERERGLDDLEDLYAAGAFEIELGPGGEATLVATIHRDDLEIDPRTSRSRELDRQVALLRTAEAPADDPVRQRLTLAADQFLVQRGKTERTIIAGYPWFADWGRDTAIALPGLCLATARAAEAKDILITFANYLDRGLLPNRFPDSGETPEYNTADATLWLFEALARYERATGDHSLVSALVPALQEVVRWHERGTRHGIGVDPRDGLLQAGEPGLALTWMDARVGGQAITPRQGKPVEIQALWYNALRLLAGWVSERGGDAGVPVASAERCRVSFNERFWDTRRASCRDVVDGPAGDDPALRPNQLIAASLTYPILDQSCWAPMLAAVEQHLLTPVGLRSLAPSDPAYVGTYGGNQIRRDGAYHQGTVWPWLLGPYVDVARRVHGAGWDPWPSIAGLVDRLGEAGLGQVSEIFGGDPPHPAAGCIAQAWSVGELLRVWRPAGVRDSTRSGDAIERRPNQDGNAGAVETSR